MKEQRLFFELAPETAPSKRWIVTVKDCNGSIKGIVVCDDKIGLLDALDEALPEDDSKVDLDFDEN